MGIEWLSEIVQVLVSAGIRAGEAFPGGKWMDLTGPVAAVGLRDLNWREGMAEFEIRILSPRALGGWKCQETAAAAVVALEEEGASCRMEPMEYQAETDCFELAVIAQQYVSGETEEAPAAGFQILIGTDPVSYVTHFSAEQDRDRRLIGTLNERIPVGVTPAAGGWRIRLVQQIPPGGEAPAEPEEPFELRVVEDGLRTLFTGCCWNRVKKSLDADGVQAEWEGFALNREETADG